MDIKTSEANGDIGAVRAGRALLCEHQAGEDICALAQRNSLLEQQLHSYASENDRLRTLAACDPLTGLYNHGHFRVHLERELARARRYERPLGLLFVDVDNFKEINDSRGHQIGDITLTEVAALLNKGRGQDASFRIDAESIAARYGGDEFVLVLPETPRAGVAIKAERLCAELRGYGKRSGTNLTVSIGTACFPDDASSPDVLIRAADMALYEAKRTGRDRVVACCQGAADEIARGD